MKRKLICACLVGVMAMLLITNTEANAQRPSASNILQRVIALEEAMEEKDQEIADLQAELADKELQIADLEAKTQFITIVEGELEETTGPHLSLIHI